MEIRYIRKGTLSKTHLYIESYVSVCFGTCFFWDIQAKAYSPPPPCKVQLMFPHYYNAVDFDNGECWDIYEANKISLG